LQREVKAHQAAVWALGYAYPLGDGWFASNV